MKKSKSDLPGLVTPGTKTWPEDPVKSTKKVKTPPGAIIYKPGSNVRKDNGVADQMATMASPTFRTKKSNPKMRNKFQGKKGK